MQRCTRPVDYSSEKESAVRYVKAVSCAKVLNEVSRTDNRFCCAQAETNTVRIADEVQSSESLSSVTPGIDSGYEPLAGLHNTRSRDAFAHCLHRQSVDLFERFEDDHVPNFIGCFVCDHDKGDRAVVV